MIVFANELSMLASKSEPDPGGTVRCRISNGRIVLGRAHFAAKWFVPVSSAVLIAENAYSADKLL